MSYPFHDIQIQTDKSKLLIESMYTVRRKDAARLAWTKHTKEVSSERDIRYSAIVTCSSLRSVAINNTGYGQSLILYIASPVDFASYLNLVNSYYIYM